MRNELYELRKLIHEDTSIPLNICIGKNFEVKSRQNNPSGSFIIRFQIPEGIKITRVRNLSYGLYIYFNKNLKVSYWRNGRKTGEYLRTEVNATELPTYILKRILKLVKDAINL